MFSTGQSVRVKQNLLGEEDGNGIVGCTGRIIGIRDDADGKRFYVVMLERRPGTNRDYECLAEELELVSEDARCEVCGELLVVCPENGDHEDEDD